MGIGSALHLLGVTLELVLLDLLLSGDNAVVIALACRRLAPQQRRQVLVSGTGIAVLLRMLLALLAALLLRLPLIKLAGGIALCVVAVRLLVDDGDAGLPAPGGSAADDAAAALRTVVIADVVMSIDNVMALSAMAHGRVAVLAAGVALTVPLLMFGSWLVARVIADYPLIEPLGAALLGWIAGSLAVSDPLYASRVEAQSPLLAVVVPALVAVYVVLQARIIRERRPRLAALRPVPMQRATAAASKADRSQAPAPAPTAVPVVAAIAVPAPPSAAPARARPRNRVRFPAGPWLAGGGVLAAGSVLFVMLYAGHEPAPTLLHTYACGDSGVQVSYLPGGSYIRLRAGSALLEGTVGAGNQIRWKPQAPGTAPLAIVPPEFITYSDADKLGLGGSHAAGLACALR